jgi:SH3 domain-containing YSC84-like protein 1
MRLSLHTIAGGALVLAALTTSSGACAGESGSAREASDAQEQVNDAMAVVNQMKKDAKLNTMLDKARGVLIIPDYGRAAAAVGGEGGEGVALLRHGASDWTAPAFYDIGGLSVGPQVGVEGGAVALLLMTDRTVQMFMDQHNNFSLDANAGLTIANWSAKGEGSAGRGDVIVWSNTKGLFAGGALAVSDIRWDADENEAFYGAEVDARTILSGNVDSDRAKPLREALSS